MNSLTTPSPPGDCAALAREMATCFGQLVKSYQEWFKLSHQAAIDRSNECTDADKQRILEAPPDQISWADLHQLGDAAPDMALERWEAIQCAALEEIRSGHRAAKSVEAAGQSPWERAQFLALRHDLAAEWQPRNGMERQIIDTMAQAQSSYLHWLSRATSRSSLDSIREKRLEEKQHRWQAPRLTDAEAIEQATEMADRFNRIFLRNLRALRDLRRYAGPVIVQKGGQLNVANEQVNVSK